MYTLLVDTRPPGPPYFNLNLQAIIAIYSANYVLCEMWSVIATDHDIVIEALYIVIQPKTCHDKFGPPPSSLSRFSHFLLLKTLSKVLPHFCLGIAISAQYMRSFLIASYKG